MMRGLARRASVILASGLWLLAATALGQPVSGAADPHAPLPAAVRLSPDGTTVTIEGALVAPVAEHVAALLDSHPGIERLRLFSTGGQLIETLALVALVERAALDTSADRLCLSACTLVLAAGRERRIEACARVGLHRFGPPPGTRMTAALSFASEWANQHAIEAMVSRGIASDFAYRAYTIPNDAMWYPGDGELFASGLATAVEPCYR